MTHLRVLLSQLPVRVGDVAGNAGAVRDAMVRAEQVAADVLVTPEMAVTGYPCEDLLAEPAFVVAAQDATRDLADHAARTVTLVGAPWTTVALPAAGGARAQAWTTDAAPRALRNTALVLHDGRLAAAHAKHLLPTYSVFDDARHFGAGVRDQALYRLETPDGPVVLGVLICEDAWDAALVAEVAAAGAQAVVVLNASPYTVGKPALRLAQLRTAAAAAGVPIAYVNAVGGQDDLVFDGGSLVVDAGGTVLARAAAFTADELVVDVPVAAARPVTRDLVDLGPTHPHRAPVATPPVAEPMEVHAEVYAALVTGFGDYCRRVGLPRVVLGLSGGIDSALAAVVAVDALGPDAVWGIGMPGPYSSDGSVTDARTLADNLGIRFDVVPVKDPYLERETVLGALLVDAIGDTGHPVAWENLQARLRGTTLMTIANAAGSLVCTTGNRSESAVGYFTLYGDSCGTAPNPLGDLLKTTVTLQDGTVLPGVYGLARWRNDQAAAAGSVPPIPLPTLTKPASAELAPGQQDSDSLPPYEVLDALLVGFLEEHASADQLAEGLVEQGWDASAAAATVNRVLGLVDRSEFKRRQVPMRVKVSRLAFGRDRRMPVASHWSHATASAATRAEPARL
ncbi:NAD+ synthase [Cellulomonas sp. URHB0016]